MSLLPAVIYWTCHSEQIALHVWRPLRPSARKPVDVFKEKNIPNEYVLWIKLHSVIQSV